MQLYGWDPENGGWDAEFVINSVEWTAHNQPIPVCSRVFGYVAFDEVPPPSWCTPLQDVYLRNDRPPRLARNRRSLPDHLVAVRSLATFPAVKRMWFDMSMYERHHFGISGVTIWDAIRTMKTRCVAPVSLSLKRSDICNAASTMTFPCTN